MLITGQARIAAEYGHLLAGRAMKLAGTRVPDQRFRSWIHP
jgi:hypothetical protein